MVLRRFFLALLSSVPVWLQAATLQPHPDILQGQLPNGVKYLIQKNALPANKLELRLVMQAGSIGETEQQRGYAHFVEHMAFQHTRHFQKQSVGQFIESLGMRIGPDSNAYTGFNETVYMLPVPANEPEKLKKSFTLLADWVDGIRFDPAEARKEAHVITEEWRLSEHQRQQMEPYENVLMAGSAYLKRRPIGDMSLVGKADIKQLEDFYHREYRPERATIIAVGDAEPKQIEQLIRQAFQDMPASSPRLEAAPPLLPLSALPGVVINRYDELQDPLIRVLYPSVRLPVDTEDALQKGLAIQLALDMFTRRIMLQAESADYPITKGGSLSDELVDRRDSAGMVVIPRNGQIVPAWQRLQQEIARVSRDGFTRAEYLQAQKNLLTTMQQEVTEAKATESDQLASQWLHDVLQQNVPTSPAQMLAAAQHWFDSDRLPDVNESFRATVQARQKLVNVIVPAQTPLASVDARQFENTPQLAALPAWQEKSVGSLTAQQVTPGTILQRTRLQEGIWQYRLSNGITLYFKPSQNTPQKVQLLAYAQGGAATLPPQDFTASLLLDDVLNQSGAGSFSLSDLDNILTGKAVDVRAWVSSYEQGLSASARTPDLEDMLALVHLGLTQPRLDDVVIQDVKQSQIKSIQQEDTRMYNQALNALGTKIWQGDFRKKPLDPAAVTAVTQDQLTRLTRQMFQQSGPWTFVMVGDAEPAQVESLAAHWLASLPDNHPAIAPVKDLVPTGGFREIRQNTAETQQFDAKDRSQTTILIRTPAPTGITASLQRQLLDDVLSQRLEQVLRQQYALVYSVAVSSEIRRHEGFRADIDFSSKSDNAAAALNAALDVIRAVREQGISTSEWEAAQQRLVRVWSEAEKSDSAILSTLASNLRNQEPLMSIAERIRQLGLISRDQVNEAARQWLSDKAISVVQVNPFSGT
ncbi:M16 family metallopeptidase [Leeia oryzae]|uniref:M16 family metallopeptidase n=1 Tax=Leeia oryzae TaxID=356662 RepID=UPI00146156A3|nr:M16 family metallopeptidase [Leeia oryzae]